MTRKMTRTTMGVLAALALGLLLAGDAALAAFIRCQTGVECKGTEQADDLVGTSRQNVMYGLGGNDILTLNDGDDEGYGGAGNDKVFGEGGNDLASGGDGNDLLEGHAGRDRLFGGPGNDVINAARFEEGAPEPDTIACSHGFDSVIADRTDVFLDRASCEGVSIV